MKATGGSGQRALAIVLSVVLLVQFIPVSAFAASPPAPTAPKPPVSRSEVPALRDRFSRTYALSDGDFERQVFLYPVNYRPAGSALLSPIDPGLDATTVAGVPVWKSRANDFTASLPATSGVGWTELTCAAGTVAFRPATRPEPGIAAARPATGSLVPMTDDGVRYPSAFSEADLEYYSMADGVAENIVLKAVPSSPVFSFDLVLDRLTPRPESDGSISLLASQDATRPTFVIPRPTMYDSTPDESGGQVGSQQVRYDIVKTPGGWRLDIAADPKWLAEPARVYPVRIDPWVLYYITDGPFGPSMSSYANSASPASNYYRVFEGQRIPVKAGYQASANYQACLYFPLFDFTDFRNNKFKIADATLRMNCISNPAGSATVKLNRIDTPWADTSLTWNNKPSTTFFGLQTVSGIGWNDFDVTSIVQSWVDGAMNRGFMLWANNDQTTLTKYDGWATSTYPDVWPTLTLRYTSTPVVTLSAPRSNSPVTGTVDVRWDYSDFAQWGESTTTVKPQESVQIQAGSDPVAPSIDVSFDSASARSYSLPATLTAGAASGTRLWVRMRASGHTDKPTKMWSDWTAWTPFTVAAPTSQQSGNLSYRAAEPLGAGAKVDLETGRLLISRSDFAGPGTGGPLSVGAVYDSANWYYNAGLGAGWSLGDPQLYKYSQAISNGSFSTVGSGGQPFSGWTATPASLVTRVSPGGGGTSYAMKISNTTGSFASVTVSSTPATTATVWPGARLHSSVLMRGEALQVDTGQAAKGGAIRLRFFDTRGALISSVKSEDFAEANTPAGTWRSVSLEATAPALARYMSMCVEYQSAKGALCVDEAVLDDGQVYFVDATGAAWVWPQVGEGVWQRDPLVGQMGMAIDQAARGAVEVTSNAPAPGTGVTGESVNGIVNGCVALSDYDAAYVSPDESGWIRYDLGSVRPISAIDMYLWDGYEAGTPRTYTYSVYVSAESSQGPWTRVADHTEGRSWQHISFEMMRARWVRVNPIAASVGDQFHICEFEVPVRRIGDEAVVFDSNFQLAAAADADANITWYRRDGSNRITNIEDKFNTSGGVRTGTARGLTLNWGGNGDLTSLDWKGIDSVGGTLNEPSAVTYSPSTASTITVYRKEYARSVPQVSYGYGGSPTRIVRIADADGVALSISYDAQGRVASATQSGAGASSTVTLTYGTNQVDVAQTGSDGTSQTRRVEFDPQVGCQPTRVTIDPAGLALQTSIYYDGYGHAVRTVDPTGAETTLTVDPHGLVTRSSAATGTIVTTTTYDSDHLTSSTDPKGNVSSVTYEKPSWRVISDATAVTDDDANGNIAQKSVYDTFGNQVEAALGAATTPNMLNNATFERNVGSADPGWDLGSGVTWDSAPAGADRYLGNHVVRLTPSGGVAASIKSQAPSLLATAGAIAASAWVAGAGEIRLISVNGASESVVRSVPFSGSATVLRRLSIEGTLSPNATSAKLQVLSTPSTGALLDNARLESSNAASDDNMVENEGFERFTVNGSIGSPNDWTKRPTGSAQHMTSGFGVVSGKLCAKIVQTDPSGNGDGYFYSTFLPVKASERYTVGGWVRPLGVVSSSGGGVQIRLHYYDSGQSLVSVDDISPMLKGTELFKRYLRQVTIPAGVAYMRIDLRTLSCTGTGYFDQVSLAPATAVEQTGYDAATHTFATETTSSAGRRSITSYDARGRATQSSYAPSAGVTPVVLSKSYYDAAGRLAVSSVSATDTSPSGSLWAFFTYTDADRLASVYAPSNAMTTMGYDARGQLTRVTSPSGIMADLSYDALGRLAATWRPYRSGYPRLKLSANAYDAAGRVATTTIYAADGVTVAGTTASTYDRASRVTGITMAGDTVATLQRGYDSIGRVTSWSSSGSGLPGSGTIGYDVASLPTTITWSWGGTSDTITNTYAKTNQLLSSRAIGRTWNYSFTADGALASVTGDMASRFAAQDEVGRLAEVRDTAIGVSGNSLISADSLSYDDYDRIARIDSTGAASGSQTYSYDLADRLKAYRSTGATVTYSYDANSNLVARGSDTFAYDTEDRLVSSNLGGAPLVYTNDDFGRRTASTWQGTTLQSYAYNPRGQLATVGSSTSTSTYWYDADGMRAMKQVATPSGTNVTMSEWSGNHPIAERDMGALPDTKYRYAYSPDGLPLAYEVKPNGGSATTYAYHTNALGDVVALTDAAGSVVASYSYDPWGRPTGIGGSNLALAARQPLRYRSYYYDNESGLYYLPARYYDPETCRFLTADPAAPSAGDPASLNRYAYCQDDPIGRSDPSGAIAISGNGGVTRLDLLAYNARHAKGAMSKVWGTEFRKEARRLKRERDETVRVWKAYTSVMDTAFMNGWRAWVNRTPIPRGTLVPTEPDGLDTTLIVVGVVLDPLPHTTIAGAVVGAFALGKTWLSWRDLENAGSSSGDMWLTGIGVIPWVGSVVNAGAYGYWAASGQDWAKGQLRPWMPPPTPISEW